MKIHMLHGHEVFLCTVFPVDHTALFHTEDGQPYRSTSSVWDTWAEADEWGDRLAKSVGKDAQGNAQASYTVYPTKINAYREKDKHGLN